MQQALVLPDCLLRQPVQLDDLEDEAQLILEQALASLAENTVLCAIAVVARSPAGSLSPQCRHAHIQIQ